MRLGFVVRHSRRFTDLDGVIFYGEAKAIPANWMISIIALLTLEARFNIGKLKRPTVTDVNTRASNTRKHA